MHPGGHEIAGGRVHERIASTSVDDRRAPPPPAGPLVYRLSTSQPTRSASSRVRARGGGDPHAHLVGSGVRIESAESGTGADVFDRDGALGEAVHVGETFGDDVRGELGTGG